MSHAITMTPTCCHTGWRLVYAGGRFTTPAESRYSPIEGEALAVVTALYKSRYFVLGCHNLILAVDHKPLLKVFGDRQLSEIDNPRLNNLKEKSLYFRFNMVHVPGRMHKGADAMSRQTRQAEVATILAGSTTKEIRLGFLCQLWTRDTTNSPDSPTLEDIMVRAGITAELSGPVGEENNEEFGDERVNMGHISGVGEGDVSDESRWEVY